jgi:riboflavin synthase
MFTGLVQSLGEIVAKTPRANDGARLSIKSPLFAQTTLGASIAVNGCCLTVTEFKDQVAHFDLLAETLRLTNLGDLQPGNLVNLEPSLTPSDRMGGHFVTGHIDGTAKIKSWQQVGTDWRLDLDEIPLPLMPHLVNKGCIAIDGISLTVAETAQQQLTIWIIPHTLQATNLHQRRAGDRVNLETDLLAKYTAKILQSRPV